MDARWNNGVLNPAFSALTADDFEIVRNSATSRTRGADQSRRSSHSLTRPALSEPLCPAVGG